MTRLTVLTTTSVAALTAAPVAAASGPFFSLHNTDFIVTLGFLLFVGILLYYRIPSVIARMLDQRAEGIRNDLEQAKALREEAKAIFASYEQRQREVGLLAEDIVANARREAEMSAIKAQEDLNASIARRLKTAEEQITAAENDAVRAVRDQAVSVAVSVASELLAQQSDAASRSAGIDAAIDEVAARLH